MYYNNFQPCIERKLADQVFGSCCERFVPPECRGLCIYETTPIEARVIVGLNTVVVCSLCLADAYYPTKQMPTVQIRKSTLWFPGCPCGRLSWAPSVWCALNQQYSSYLVNCAAQTHDNTACCRDQGVEDIGRQCLQMCRPQVILSPNNHV